MYRYNFKTGARVADEHCNTSTVPHRFAKQKVPTGNYGLADDARIAYSHLVLKTDPKTGMPLFPARKEDPKMPEKPTRGDEDADESLYSNLASASKEESDPDPWAKEQELMKREIEKVDQWLSARRTKRAMKRVAKAAAENAKESKYAEFSKAVKAIGSMSVSSMSMTSEEESEEEVEKKDNEQVDKKEIADDDSISTSSDSDSERLKPVDQDDEIDFSCIYREEALDDSRVWRNYPGADFKLRSKYVDYFFLGRDPALEYGDE